VAIVQGSLHSAVQPIVSCPSSASAPQPFSLAPLAVRRRASQPAGEDVCASCSAHCLNDRISMRSSIELREPFLDHRLVSEVAFWRITKIDGNAKWLLRHMRPRSSSPATVLPRAGADAQREWLGPLRDWADAQITDGSRRSAARRRPCGGGGIYACAGAEAVSFGSGSAWADARFVSAMRVGVSDTKNVTTAAKSGAIASSCRSACA
jgi:hypothetical protein